MALLSIGVVAQTSDDEYNKNEFYVGYSNQQVRIPNRGFNGFEASYVRNVSRYFGVKGDFSAAYQNRNFSFPIVAGEPIVVENNTETTHATFNGDFNSSKYNLLGGVQIKDNASKARFKLFAHALAGVGHSRSKIKKIGCVSNCSSVTFNTENSNFSNTGLSGAFGGGLDIKINEKIDFRAIQADYNPIYSGSRVNNSFRFGIGLVFK